MTISRRTVLKTTAGAAAIASMIPTVAIAQSTDNGETQMAQLQPGLNAVKIPSGNETLAANVYLPSGYDGKSKLPSVVLTVPATGVKEQTVGVYGQKLAEKGYLTVAFDPTGWGESTGRRFVMDPFAQANDMKNVTTYLQSLAQADPERMFNMGICRGAEVATYATAYDPRVKALALASPYVDAARSYVATAGGGANLRKTILAQIAQAKAYFAKTGNEVFIKLVPETQAEIDAAPTEVTRGMAAYYLPGKPGNTSNWNNQLNAAGSDNMISFDPLHYIHMLEEVPVIVAYGSEAVTAPGALTYIEALPGPHEVAVIKGADHFDLYWKDEFVDIAVADIDVFFRNT